MNSKWVSVFLWFCLFLIPVSYNFWGMDPALYSKFFLLDVVLLAASAVLFAKCKQALIINGATAVFTGLYICYIIVSAYSIIAFAINKPDGWFVWLHFAICPVLVLQLILMNQITAIKRTEVAAVISWLAFVSATIGLFQYAVQVSNHGWLFANSDNVKASFAHKNIFAEIMLITLPFSFYTGFFEGKKIHRLTVALTILIVALLLSRAVWFGFAAALFACGFIYLLSNKRHRFSFSTILNIILSLILISIISVWLLQHTGAGNKLLTFYQNRPSVYERKELWRVSWQIIQQHPLWGSGAGSWKVLNMRYGIVGLRNYSTFFQQPHNDTLWIICEQGLLGFIMLSAAWLCLLYILMRQIFAKPDDIFLYGLLFALAGYWGYSNFAFPRERAEHGIIMAFVAFYILKDYDGFSSFRMRMPKYIFVLIPVWLSIAAWFAGNKMFCEINLRHYFEARENNDPDAEIKYLDKINSAYSTLDGTATPVSWYLGMAHFAQKNKQALIDFDNAVKANPYHAYSLANLATCLTQQGNTEDAEKYFRLSLAYSQGFPEAALNMAALKFNAGQTDSAAYYMGMVNDSGTNPRYRQFLQIIMRAAILPLKDSAAAKGDSLSLIIYNNMLQKDDWLMHICKDAFNYKRSIGWQIQLDAGWSAENDYHYHDSGKNKKNPN